MALRKVTKAKLEINNLAILKRPYFICRHVTVCINELVTANCGQNLFYNAQFYILKLANRTKFSKPA